MIWAVMTFVLALRCSSRMIHLKSEIIHSSTRIPSDASEAEFSAPLPIVSFALTLGGDIIEVVEMRNVDDAELEAARIAQLHPDQADAEGLAEVLRSFWTSKFEATVYEGPCCQELEDITTSIELPKVGIALEVAKSCIPDAGKGLFLRKLPGVHDTSLYAGSALCGYAAGIMAPMDHADGGKTFEFRLDEGLESSVWFKGHLQAVWQAMEASGVSEIVGHRTVYNDEGNLIVDIVHDPEATSMGRQMRFFVPAEPQPEPLDIETIGQMANDFALDNFPSNMDFQEAYAEASECHNLLGVVPRLVLDNEDAPTRLEPFSPVLTVLRSVIIENEASMEVGCRYGEQYWSRE